MPHSRSRSGVIVLAALAVISAMSWFCDGPDPVFVFGVAAVLWLWALLLRGVFSAPLRPFPDDPQLPPS
jgi:hypothetical protein